MNQRHQHLIDIFDGLIHSGDAHVRGVRVFNRGTMNSYTLYDASAEEMRNLMLCETYLQELKKKEMLWKLKHGAIDLAQFNEIVTVAMEVAKAANWTHQTAPQTAAFMERVLVGAVVAYVMNRFDIKRV